MSWIFGFKDVDLMVRDVDECLGPQMLLNTTVALTSAR